MDDSSRELITQAVLCILYVAEDLKPERPRMAATLFVTAWFLESTLE